LWRPPAQLVDCAQPTASGKQSSTAEVSTLDTATTQRTIPGKTLSEYVATTTAGLRVISCVDQTIQTIDEENEVLVFPFTLHLGDRHHTNTVILHTQQGLTSNCCVAPAYESDQSQKESALCGDVNLHRLTTSSAWINKLATATALHCGFSKSDKMQASRPCALVP